MGIILEESGMYFGTYAEENLFHMEKSTIYKSLGKGVSTIEFILSRRQKDILFIEAKSSSPKPNVQIDFDVFIDEIHDKFAHSIEVFFSLILGRKKDVEKELSETFRLINQAKADIKLILVINGHKVEWLPPIEKALHIRLKRQIRTWRLKLTVLNNEMACEYGLLSI